MKKIFMHALRGLAIGRIGSFGCIEQAEKMAYSVLGYPGAPLNIKVEPYILTFNRYNKPQYFQCRAVDQRPLPYGWYGTREERCGADATVVVTRTSLMTGNTYSDHMCDRHAEGWRMASGVTV